MLGQCALNKMMAIQAMPRTLQPGLTLKIQHLEQERPTLLLLQSANSPHTKIDYGNYVE